MRNIRGGYSTYTMDCYNKPVVLFNATDIPFCTFECSVNDGLDEFRFTDILRQCVKVVRRTFPEIFLITLCKIRRRSKTYRSVYEFPEFAEYGKLISFAFVIVVATTDDLGIDIETL